MVHTAPLAADQHVDRAEYHISIGRSMHETDNEWPAVGYFYGAYHYVKAALLDDPIWRDAGARARVSVELTPAERTVSRHHGHRGGAGRVWGVNELDMKLYPAIFRAYEQLHQGSIAVRYHVGLDDDALPDLATWCEQIQDAYEDGKLVAVHQA